MSNARGVSFTNVWRNPNRSPWHLYKSARTAGSITCNHHYRHYRHRHHWYSHCRVGVYLRSSFISFTANKTIKCGCILLYGSPPYVYLPVIGEKYLHFNSRLTYWLADWLIASTDRDQTVSAGAVDGGGHVRVCDIRAVPGHIATLRIEWSFVPICIHYSIILFFFFSILLFA